MRVPGSDLEKASDDYRWTGMMLHLKNKIEKKRIVI